MCDTTHTTVCDAPAGKRRRKRTIPLPPLVTPFDPVVAGAVLGAGKVGLLAGALLSDKIRVHKNQKGDQNSAADNGSSAFEPQTAPASQSGPAPCRVVTSTQCKKVPRLQCDSAPSRQTRPPAYSRTLKVTQLEPQVAAPTHFPTRLVLPDLERQVQPILSLPGVCVGSYC